MNGELLSVEIEASGIVTSPSQLQITCTAWSGLGLTPSQLNAVSEHIRASMTAFPDSAIGWTNREVDLIGGGGPIPTIVLDAPVGIARFEDYVHAAAAINQAGTDAAEVSAGVVDALTASPSPFVRETRLQFSLPNPAVVSVRIYDVSGRLVRTLHTGHLGSGHHELPWNGCNDARESVGPGTYFVRAESGGRMLVAKVIRVN